MLAFTKMIVYAVIVLGVTCIYELLVNKCKRPPMIVGERFISNEGRYCEPSLSLMALY
jgi:hypothetical protein